MAERDLFDVSEATRITGLDKATLYKLAREGRIRSFKVLGTALRFERNDLVALIEERPART
jgi:excisionase family DNA binding protein